MTPTLQSMVIIEAALSGTEQFECPCSHIRLGLLGNILHVKKLHADPELYCTWDNFTPKCLENGTNVLLEKC
jgi:hypothetical protein